MYSEYICIERHNVFRCFLRRLQAANYKLRFFTSHLQLVFVPGRYSTTFREIHPCHYQTDWCYLCDLITWNIYRIGLFHVVNLQWVTEGVHRNDSGTIFIAKHKFVCGVYPEKRKKQWIIILHWHKQKNVGEYICMRTHMLTHIIRNNLFGFYLLDNITSIY